MTDSLAALCGRFGENRALARAAFPWDSLYFYPLCAAVLTRGPRQADRETLGRCARLLKRETGLFSGFRGASKLVMIAHLAAAEDPQAAMESALQAYEALRVHFRAGQYLALAALFLADLGQPQRNAEIAARAGRLYQMMRQRHPLRTGGPETAYAALLALAAGSEEELIRRAEQCDETLGSGRLSAGAARTLGNTLALGEGLPEEVCDRALALTRAIQERGRTFHASRAPAVLGALCLLPGEVSALAEDLLAADACLAGQRGYGFFGVDKKQRLIHAALLTALDRMGEKPGFAPAAAWRAALCAASAVARAASSAASAA